MTSRQGGARGDEFRTAPLWGLGQRIFFLHDGRTSDLVQAIREHRSAGNATYGHRRPTRSSTTSTPWQLSPRGSAELPALAVKYLVIRVSGLARPQMPMPTRSICWSSCARSRLPLRPRTPFDGELPGDSQLAEGHLGTDGIANPDPGRAVLARRVARRQI